MVCNLPSSSISGLVDVPIYPPQSVRRPQDESASTLPCPPRLHEPERRDMTIAALAVFEQRLDEQPNEFTRGMRLSAPALYIDRERLDSHNQPITREKPSASQTNKAPKAPTATPIAKPHLQATRPWCWHVGQKRQLKAPSLDAARCPPAAATSPRLLEPGAHRHSQPIPCVLLRLRYRGRVDIRVSATR
jgi:hypothetical protein